MNICPPYKACAPWKLEFINSNEFWLYKVKKPPLLPEQLLNYELLIVIIFS